MESNWALHNSLKGWTLFNLSSSELRLVLLSLSQNELKLAKISKKGDSGWQTFDKNLHFDLADPAATLPYADQTGYPVVSVRPDTATDTEYFVIKPNKVRQPRMHRRIEKNIPCILVAAEREFKTETVDISEGGLHFKDVIPSWVSGYFLVIVNGQFQLMCSLVEDQKEKKRVQIVSEESDFNFIQYKVWLEKL